MAQTEVSEEQQSISTLAIDIPPQRQRRTNLTLEQRLYCRLSRNRHSLFELDIPPLGLTNTSRRLLWLAACLLSLSVIISGVIIVLISERALDKQSAFLFCAIAVCNFLLLWCSAFFIITLVQTFWFRHETLTITIENYTLIRRLVPFVDIVKSLCQESYHDLAKSGILRLGKTRKFYGSRQQHLEAKIVNYEGICGNTVSSIEFNFVSFAFGVPSDELQWLVHETNDFLGNLV